jgi:hypothetical protein
MKKIQIILKKKIVLWIKPQKNLILMKEVFILMKKTLEPMN